MDSLNQPANRGLHEFSTILEHADSDMYDRSVLGMYSHTGVAGRDEAAA